MSDTQVTRIRIGRHLTGFVGLQTVFKDMAGDFAGASDATAAAALIDRLSETNYIPASVHASYGPALVRAFRKYLGQPYQEETAPHTLEIKVLGAGCAICDGLENDLMEVLAEVISSSMLRLGSSSGACSRKATFRSFLKVNAPPSAASFPARILKRVVFPVPFLAIMAALSPLDKPKVMPSKSTCSPNALDRFSADR